MSVLRIFVAVLVLTGAVSCSTPKAKIVVPGSALQVADYLADGSPQRQLIRMSDGVRDWEVELPDQAGGYELRIPMSSVADGSPPWDPHRLTAADKELLAQIRRESPDNTALGLLDGGGAEEAAPAPATTSDSEAGDPQTAASAAAESRESPPSYLMGVQEIQKLYQAGQYELALVRLTALQEAYPDDVKLLTMKGTLWLKIGRHSLALQAWEQVLHIDPHNRAVLAALRQLER